jgi:hypothetical protein
MASLFRVDSNGNGNSKIAGNPDPEHILPFDRLVGKSPIRWADGIIPSKPLFFVGTDIRPLFDLQ